MTTDTTGGAGGTSTPPWYDAFDADTKGYIQNKGLDKKTAPEAFLEAAKFHREAEKFVGAPANELVRLPKDPNAPEWKNIYERLGAPKDASGYDFSTVKNADGTPLDAEFTEYMRSTVTPLNLSKDAAAAVTQAMVKFREKVDATALAERTAKLEVQKAELKKNWGVNEAANMVVARAAAKALNVAPEAVAALEGQVGYAAVMEMFRTIGTKIGEDRFVASSGGGGNGVMTRDQAVAEKDALKADQAWVKRFLSGGNEERKKMDALDRIIVGIA